MIFKSIENNSESSFGHGNNWRVHRDIWKISNMGVYGVLSIFLFGNNHDVGCLFTTEKILQQSV